MFVTRHIAPILTEAGFAGEGVKYSRDRHWCIDLVEVQEPNASDGTFTINLGISVEEIERVVWGPDFETHEPSSVLRRRIGELLKGEGPKKRDVCWSVISRTAPMEVASALREGAIPFFNAVNTLIDLRREMAKSPRWLQGYWLHKVYSAVLEAKLGDKTSAAKALEPFAKDKSMSSLLARVAAQLGIELTMAP